MVPHAILGRYGRHGPPCICTRWCNNEYRHMCYFFNYMIYQYDILKPYDYIWRMDATVGLAKPIMCDVFEVCGPDLGPAMQCRVFGWR